MAQEVKYPDGDKGWEAYQVYDPLTVQRRLDVEANTYDPGGRMDVPYIERLLGLSENIRRQLPNQPGAYEVNKRLMENAGELIAGPTNFSANPQNYINPNVRLQSATKRTRLPETDPEYISPITEGSVWPNNPQDVYINPGSPITSTSSLLGHEMGHTGHLGIENLVKNARASGKSLPIGAEYEWMPKFSNDFMTDLERERSRPGSPYQWKSGFGTKYDESFAFLLGREAELPAGQTLKDDPSTAYIFAKHPKMYDEYERARNTVRAHWLKKRK